MYKFKIGSLFSGAGGFEFAAQICGIEPVWASEIEPFPVAVTSKRFPNMKHLGDVTKVNGAEIEPVDIITFGSPCQDLSVAGKRAGLEGERSGLFMEAIRIIKEMRDATANEFPRFGVWENVPGAFSSAKGEDFRAVLEAFCQVVNENADVPRPANGKWSYAGEIMGDGYSVAWRTLDAQYWGVPQRRRRIFLVADFRGERAGEILFEREGLSRNFTESRETWKGITKSLAFGVGDKERNIAEIMGLDHVMLSGGTTYQGKGYYEGLSGCLKTQPHGVFAIYDTRGNGDGGHVYKDICGTIRAEPGDNRMTVLCVRERCGCEGGGKGCLVQENVTGAIACHNDQFLCYAIGHRGEESRVINLNKDDVQSKAVYDIAGIAAALYSGEKRGGGGEAYVCYAVDCRNARLQEVNGTLQAKPNGGISYNLNNVVFIPAEIILRRLTPTECARLQGMPDWWCDDVPHSDSAEYKMWGNGMALPCVLYVMEGIEEVLEKDE